MLSAFKRFTRSGGDVTVSPSGPQALPLSLQKKFSKGIQYNMKIILKGDRNSGKTCLFRRLQGLPFLEEYNPTNEIQVANIQWNYKTTDDVVKVEIWDVVDKAKKKKQVSQTLKMENVESPQADLSPQVEEIALDASFLDVYKNTQGVILIFDITKTWTFDYVKREIESIPLQTPILILGNHRDMGHHRAISGDTVLYFIESLERKPGSGEIRYCESSMRNSYGLKFIHKFFNLPFLQLQKETLLKQLDTNAEEKLVTVEELTLYLESDDANYDLFIDGLTLKRRQVADSLSAPVPKITVEEAKELAAARDKEKEGSSSTDGGSASVPPTSIKPVTPPLQPSSTETPTGTPQNTTSKKEQIPRRPPVAETKESDKNKSMGAKDPVQDFVPDESGHIESSFFTEGFTAAKPEVIRSKNDVFESSDEEDVGNPMVTSYVEDIDPDLLIISSTRRPGKLSSSDDELVGDSKGSPPQGRPQVSNQTSSSPENGKRKEKKRHKTKTKHRHDSAGTKKQIDLEMFLNGSPEDVPRSPVGLDYEPL